MTRISKRTVDAAKPDPQGKRVYLWDGDVKGFGLLILPSGVKTYFYRYRNTEQQERRATIGKHGTWTAEEARRKADYFRRTVSEGRDPLREKRQLQAAPTVASLLDAYVEGERFKSKSEWTQISDKSRIACHLKPLLGKRHVQSLTPGDVERAFADIRDGKTARNEKTRKRGRSRVRGGEGAARMAIRLLRAAINWGIGQGVASANACSHVNIGTDGVRDVILDDVAAYKRLFETLDRMEHERRLRAPAADAIKLIALTGARKGEIVGLRWTHVDLKRGLVTLPPKSHKAGRRTGKPRIIGLPAAAQAIIARQPQGTPEDLVFMPASGEGVISLSKPWTQVRAEAKLPDGIGLHGLRHSLASHMAMGGAAAAEIMTALGHTQLSTTQRYLHWAQDSRQALSERAASVVVAGMTGPPTENSATRNPAKVAAG
jgi:integrase